MAVKIPWKSLSKQDAFSLKLGAFSSKQLAFFAVAGLVLVVGLVLRAAGFFDQPEVVQNAPVTVPAPAPSTATTPAPSTTATPGVEPAPSIPQPQPAAPETATAPNQPAGQTGNVVEQTEPTGEAVEQTELPDAGTILVSKRPVEVLSGPSSTASAMYGFPAGRPFRVIGRQGGFAQIKDVESGASGWIDEAALAPPPSAPSVSAPSRAQPDAVSRTRVTGPADPKPKPAKKSGQATADSEAAEPAQTRKRPGLFGGGGPFRGLFGGGN